MLHICFGHYVTQCAENKTAALKYMFFGVEYGYGCSVHILLVRFEVIIDNCKWNWYVLRLHWNLCLVIIILNSPCYLSIRYSVSDAAGQICRLAYGKN